MDKLITIDGIDYIVWKDENGNEWRAEKDIVKFFGKKAIEEMPSDIFLGSWQVEYCDEYLGIANPENTNPYNLSDCFIYSKRAEEFADSLFNF